MRRRRAGGSLRLVAALMLAALLPLALASPGLAQQAPSSAELKRVIGRVEILRKGQTQWIPAVIGARLVEGDDIRAFSGAQAELALPDTSTVLLVENSRLLITKIEYDRAGVGQRELGLGTRECPDVVSLHELGPDHGRDPLGLALAEELDAADDPLELGAGRGLLSEAGTGERQ